MWFETVGLRTRTAWDQKICLLLGLGLGLARCGLRLGLTGLVCCVVKHVNFSSIIYSFSILCLEHHYCGDQQWCSLTYKINPPSAFVYFRWSWSWSCYFGLGLGLKNLVLFTSLPRLFGNYLNPNKVNPQISKILRKFPRSGDTAIDSLALSILIFFLRI